MNETPHIKIQVETQYLDDQSSDDDHHYVFAYRISIINEGTMPAKLLSRHWVITNADGQVQEVKGSGVVGEQPYLRPGETFQYTSGAVIETPVGTMQGSYHMIDDHGREFDIPIPPFRLAAQGALLH